MKSRISVKKDSVIAVYGFDNNKLKSLKDVAFRYNIRLKTVSESEKNMTVSEIIKNNYDSADEILFDDNILSCMLMSDIESKTMDRLLDDIRKNKLDIPLKAVVTPYNLKWKFSKLIEELEKEYENFSHK
jgi:hypothetical protein